MAELIFFLLKPLKLFSFNIIFPVGPLAPVVSSTTAALCTGFMLFLFYPMVDVFFITVAERHFQITSTYSINKLWHRIFAYGMLLVTEILTFGFFVNFLLKSIDDFKAKEILTRNVKNVEILFNLQPSFFIVQIDLNFNFLMALTVALVSGIYRWLFCLWFLLQNLAYGKNTILSQSNRIKNQLSLMLYSSITQAIVTISAGIFGVLWILLFLIHENNLTYISLIAVSLMLLYPIIDVIIVVIAVKPYRRIVKKMFNKNVH